MSDQGRISPHNINTISGIEVIKINSGQIDNIRIVWQTVNRITNEILGVEELTVIRVLKFLHFPS